MLFLLIFPILVSGFIACHIHPVHSFSLHRYEGQYLYLISAKLGLYCFIIGFFLALGLHFCVPTSLQLGCLTINIGISEFLEGFMEVMGADGEYEAAKMAWFFILSALSVFSAFLIKVWGHITLRLRFGQWNVKVFVIGELLDDSPLDSLLFRLSLAKDKYVMLSMEDRKVYVGKVISLGEPTETNGMDQDISILPLMSGYRDKDTLKVEFKTHYKEVDSDIYLSLRQDSIVSATEFNFDAYNTWNKSLAAGHNLRYS